MDDLDGGTAAETVSFSLDGTGYEIDLNKKNAAALRKLLERYIDAGRHSSTPANTKQRRRSTTATSKSTKGSAASRGYDLVALREWAAANDIAVPSRGRIPQAVIEQYRSADGR